MQQQYLLRKVERKEKNMQHITSKKLIDERKIFHEWKIFLCECMFSLNVELNMIRMKKIQKNWKKKQFIARRLNKKK